MDRQLSKGDAVAAQDKIKGFAASGQLGMFASGYWGHPAMHLPPDVNLIAFTHYLQALEYQRKALQVVGMLGGKTPHIQNLAVGGVQNAINLDSMATMNMDRLYMIKFSAGCDHPVRAGMLLQRRLHHGCALSRVVQLRQAAWTTTSPCPTCR